MVGVFAPRLSIPHLGSEAVVGGGLLVRVLGGSGMPIVGVAHGAATEMVVMRMVCLVKRSSPIIVACCHWRVGGGLL